MPTFTNDVSAEAGVNAIEGVSADGIAIVGKSATNYGLRAHSTEIAGIRGSSDKSRGVEGWAGNSEGVVGISATGNGVWGQTDGAGIGVLGTSISGAGVVGKGTPAGRFEGNVEVAGGLKVTGSVTIGNPPTSGIILPYYFDNLFAQLQLLQEKVAALERKVGI